MANRSKCVAWMCILLCQLLATTSGARILGVFPTNTQSHYVMYGSLMREMAARGHHVTVVNHFPSKKNITNFIDISLDGTLPALSNNISIDVPLAMSPLGNHIDMIYDCMESCEIGLNHPEVQQLLDPKKHKFDLFVTEIFGSECFLALAYKLGIPSVGVVSSVNLPWVNDMVANPDNPAYVPLYFYPLTQWMNFYERLYNTVMTVVIKLSYEVLANWPSHKLAEDALGPVPSISTMARNFSLILLNSHFSINQVRPWVPQIVEVGGLHIKGLGELPLDIKKFLDESPHGVVYFSFGSMLKMESIPLEKLQQVITVLGNLKERVLWKVNATNLPDLPPNIKTFDWMPQIEVLCHPATKVFISHGGLLGSQEAITCGVPILGVPLFADQALNLAELERRGVAQVINYYDVNKDTVETALHKLLNDTSYRENMKELSQLFTDRPQHPMDTAIYWLEYTIKYKGAKHLRSAALDLTWYQYLLLDVISFILICTIFVILIIRFLIKRILKLMNTSKNIDKHKATVIQNGNLKMDSHVQTNHKHANGNITSNGNIPVTNGHILLQDHKPNGYETADQIVLCENIHSKCNGHSNGITSTNNNTKLNDNITNGHIASNGHTISNGYIKTNGHILCGHIETKINGFYNKPYQNGTSHLNSNIEKIINTIEQFRETGHPKWE